MATTARDALWQQGSDETVEVNQRALIDKVLARYSGEFTVFRELLQNADDAYATSAEIRFDTKAHLIQLANGEPNAAELATTDTSAEAVARKKPNLPDLKKATVDQWTFRNNGTPFRNEDWNRLKKIAEGNPDEQKIGAFGVGFYSLFSVTEQPFVKSGTEWMGFYWRNGGDQLFARRGDLPPNPNPSTPSDSTEWTSFEMPLREAAPLPGLPVDIARFLATSLTFMTHLRSVSMFFDGQCLARVEKEVGFPRHVAIPRGLKSTSPGGMMNVTGITSTSLYMKATVLRWVYDTGTEKLPPPSDEAAKPAPATSFFSSLFSSFAYATPPPAPTPAAPPEPQEDPLEEIVSLVQLSVYAAQVSVRLDKHISNELERATQKKPPATSTYQLIYTGRDEYDAYKKVDEKEFRSTGSVFQGLRADLDGTGHARIFIGHATAQTTGIGGHAAARFIPTVERESIDLVDRNVSLWNKELLYVGGFLARAVYELELNSIGELWSIALSGTSTDDEVDKATRAWLQSRCLHVLLFFTFHPTTPSIIVSEQFRAAFFAAGAAVNHPFPIISTLGVRSARDVRGFNSALIEFLKNTPMLPPEADREGELMLAALRERGLCLDVTFQDVLDELKARILDEQEAIALLKWRVGLDADLIRAHGRELSQAFLEAAVLCIKEGGNDDKASQNKVKPLAAIRTYVNPRSSVIPLDSPLPSHTIPFSISKQLGTADLKGLFGWMELTILDWVEYLVDPNTRKETGVDITLDPIFAERVIGVLARAWPSMNPSQQREVCLKLGDVPCIPTRVGLKIPGEAYFSNAHVFPDLPTIVMPKGTAIKAPMEKVLVALGVRRHVDLQIVFTRMIHSGDWSAADLIKYLIAVRDSLTVTEIESLKQTATFMCEGENGARETKCDSAPKRYMAKDLYEPIGTLRDLGLPVILWGEQAKWRSSSGGAKFMFELGLNRSPPLETILALIGAVDLEKRALALKYFMDNHSSRYAAYQPDAFKHLSFVPAVKLDGTKFLTNPMEVYSNTECAVMGFSVVDPSLDKETILQLQIASDPPTRMLLTNLLGSPPIDQARSRKYYEYLAGRIADFTPAELDRMSDTAFIPAAKTTVRPNGYTNSTKQMFKPTQVYFDGAPGLERAHMGFFTFVDFGSKAATFLRAVGVKDEPTTQEICAIIMQDPKAFKDAIGGYDQYLAELRGISAQAGLFPPATQRLMARSPMLLGTRRIVKKSVRSPKERGALDSSDDESDVDIHFELLRAEDILIVDDAHANSLFGHEIWGAPQEDVIEQFYEVLGSRRLSALINEDYKYVGSQDRSTKRAQDTRALVLERLPLFLYERTHAKSLIRPDWLAEGDHFQVVMVNKLQLTRRLSYGRGFSATQEASAAAKRGGPRGPVVLWLAESSQTDLYEVANSLCNVLFTHHKINDSLLFMTILSTDLRALKRRGYNIDRILNQQKVERVRAEAARVQLERERKKAQEAKTRPIAGASGQHGIPPYSLIENNVRMAIAACTPESQSPLRNRRQMSMVKESLDEGYCDISGTTADFVLAGQVAGYRVYITKDVSGPGLLTAQKPDAMTRFGSLIITPLRTLYKLPPKDVPEPGLFTVQKADVLTRFGNLIINPLQTLYKLTPSSVHIFCDTKGQTIAFNRNGGLFLNLRYYEAWHDELVKAGNLHKALISWYFSLAHEIAHNLVQPHNAEHEYYFSSLAEAHMPGFSALLSQS